MLDFLQKMFGNPANDPQMPQGNLTADNLPALMAYLRQPTANDKLMAASKALSAIGQARMQGGDIGMALGSGGQAMTDTINQANQGRLGELQSQLELKKLFTPKFNAPTTRSIGQIRNGRNYTVNQQFNENTGQWENVGEKEERDWDAAKATSALDQKMNDLKLRIMESKLETQNAPKPTPEQAGLEQFRKAEAIKKAETAAAMPAMIGLMDQAEQTVKSYLPEIKAGDKYVTNPDFNQTAYDEIMSEGGAGQYVPKAFKSGTSMAAGKARMDQLEAFGKTLSGADFAQLFKPMSNADIQMIGSLASIMADPAISDTSRLGAMRKFYEEYMPKMREAATKKMQLSPAPSAATPDDDLINKYLD